MKLTSLNINTTHPGYYRLFKIDKVLQLCEVLVCYLDGRFVVKDIKGDRHFVRLL
jgi:hypothetical protein